MRPVSILFAEAFLTCPLDNGFLRIGISFAILGDPKNSETSSSLIDGVDSGDICATLSTSVCPVNARVNPKPCLSGVSERTCGTVLVFLSGARSSISS